jgi:hypothetical protein
MDAMIVVMGRALLSRRDDAGARAEDCAVPFVGTASSNSNPSRATLQRRRSVIVVEILNGSLIKLTSVDVLSEPCPRRTRIPGMSRFAAPRRFVRILRGTPGKTAFGPTIEPGAPRDNQIAYRQINAAASSVLPVPLYRAVIGYAHSGCVRTSCMPRSLRAMMRDGASPCSTQRRMMPA